MKVKLPHCYGTLHTAFVFTQICGLNKVSVIGAKDLSDAEVHYWNLRILGTDWVTFKS